MIKRFLISYILGILLFGVLFFALQSQINPSTVEFRPEPLQAEGITLQEVMP